MKIEHDREQSKFRARLGTYEAVLMYGQKDKVLDFYHIYVPDPFRNRSIAADILKTAFGYARENGFRVVASCPFIAHDFLPRFPEYQDLIDSGVFPFAQR